MSDIRFDKVKKVYDNDVVALDEFSLHIKGPRLVVLVGPSGCGKTTLLRLIAGLETPTAGEIFLGDDRIDNVDPRDRDVAMVFQSYALYPHMTVAENLSFGLKIRRTPKDVIKHRVDEVARSLEIHDYLDRKPAQLSGGQRQRVALGRAVIREPRVFLFDEPLSNLDARLRDEMRYMIKRLYQRLQTSTVYVTHDQVEAMTIGELLVVMKDGRIHQVGSPEECYHQPHDQFVASFLGSPPMNLLRARLSDDTTKLQVGERATLPLPDGVMKLMAGEGGREIIVGFRPEDGRQGGAGLTLSGRLLLDETLGHEHLSHLDVDGQEVIVRAPRGLEAGEDGSAELTVDPGALHYFSASSGRRLDTASV